MQKLRFLLSNSNKIFDLDINNQNNIWSFSHSHHSLHARYRYIISIVLIIFFNNIKIYSRTFDYTIQAKNKVSLRVSILTIHQSRSFFLMMKTRYYKI